MTTSEIPFTEIEKKTRKNWLVLFIILNTPFALLSLSCMGTLLFGMWEMLLVFPLLTFCFFSGPYALYYCAYRKSGTICLTINLVFYILLGLGNLFSLAILVLSYFSLPLKNAFEQKGGGIEHLLVLSAVMLILHAFWIPLSLKLRKVNQDYKKREAYADTQFHEFVKAMHNSSNKEELNSSFRAANNVLPYFSSYLSKEYKQKKKEFS